VLHSSEVNSMLDGYYEHLSAPHHLQFKSLDAWQQRREIVRRQMLQDIGLDPLPERLPLDVHYGGALDREDYLLRRVYFQTWPGGLCLGLAVSAKDPGQAPGYPQPAWTLGERGDASRDAIVLHRFGEEGLRGIDGRFGPPLA
jgi:hypothetical protein